MKLRGQVTSARSKSSSKNMRRSFFVFAHRWVGLTMAGFLILVGLTGALLAFLPELNHWLSPRLFPGGRASRSTQANWRFAPRR
jgi:uncharacterized iron-regulated membrane protein